MNLTEDKYVEATYEWCSMAGSYNVDCKIHGWDDKSERFAISFYDPIMQEVDYRWAPYNQVTGWTWQSLSKTFVTN